jgi:serpin B
MKYLGISVSLITAALLVTCNNSTEPVSQEPSDKNPVFTPPDRTVAQLTEDEKNLVQAQNEFSFDLFHTILDSTPAGDNVFISPLSVSYALGMFANGIEGQTYSDLRSVLHVADMQEDTLNTSYANLTYILTHSDDDVDFSLANALWYASRRTIHDTFALNCTEYFDAAIRATDFGPGTADTINAWVRLQTNDKIETIVTNEIEQMPTSMVLLNAIYFKGDWTIPFEKNLTRDETFLREDGTEKPCAMMYKDSEEDTTLHYYRGNNFAAADLPYGNKNFAMTVILPDEGTAAGDIASSMTAQQWRGIITGMSGEGFFLALPKFTVEFETGLIGILEKLGVTFADEHLSRIFSDGATGLSSITHKTFVQVDEEGTEATGVTVIITVDSLPLQVRCDRPFLFVIHERNSGAILFMGRVADPEI